MRVPPMALRHQHLVGDKPKIRSPLWELHIINVFL